MLQVAWRGFAMLLRFARAYPLTALITAAIYGGSAALAAAVVAPMLPTGWAGWYIASWAATLPQTVLLTPVWTSLLRFVIVGDERRGYFTVDFRVLRVLRVTLVLWAVLMAGGIAPAVAASVLPHFLHGRLGLVVLGMTLLTKPAAWWLGLRLAIAPTLAAAGTRPYPLDTAFAFTRGWFWSLLAVRAVIYGVYGLPFAVLMLVFLGQRAVLMSIDADPRWIAVATALIAIAEATDRAAMALMTQRIVRERSAGAGEPEDAEADC